MDQECTLFPNTHTIPVRKYLYYTCEKLMLTKYTSSTWGVQIRLTDIESAGSVKLPTILMWLSFIHWHDRRQLHSTQYVARGSSCVYPGKYFFSHISLLFLWKRFAYVESVPGSFIHLSLLLTCVNSVKAKL